MADAAHVEFVLGDANGGNVSAVRGHAQAVVENLFAATAVGWLKRAFAVLPPRVDLPTPQTVVALAVPVQHTRQQLPPPPRLIFARVFAFGRIA